MTNEQIMSYVDHTVLKATATWGEIEKLCEEAIAYKAATVCIPPSYIARVKEAYKDLKIATVIGFPLGYQTKEVKAFESKQALSEGADDIDMVINLGDVKNKDFEKITEEIREIKKAVGSNILKVIVETCYLTEDEKIALCKCVTDAGADYIKTSTGFGTGGATVADIELFKKHIGENIEMKASGGIRTKEDMETLIQLGCKRLGTSSAVEILYGDK